MQDITPLLKEGAKAIEAYGNGGFKVAGEKFAGNIIILPDAVYKFESNSVENAGESALASLISNSTDIDILLVGGGEKTEFFSPEIEAALRSKRITVEYMSTGAAVRTYNVLLSEERKVAVVLIAV